MLSQDMRFWGRVGGHFLVANQQGSCILNGYWKLKHL